MLVIKSKQPGRDAQKPSIGFRAVQFIGRIKKKFFQTKFIPFKKGMRRQPTPFEWYHPAVLSRPGFVFKSSRHQLNFYLQPILKIALTHLWQDIIKGAPGLNLNWQFKAWLNRIFPGDFDLTKPCLVRDSRRLKREAVKNRKPFSKIHAWSPLDVFKGGTPVGHFINPAALAVVRQPSPDLVAVSEQEHRFAALPMRSKFYQRSMIANNSGSSGISETPKLPLTVHRNISAKTDFKDLAAAEVPFLEHVRVIARLPADTHYVPEKMLIKNEMLRQFEKDVVSGTRRIPEIAENQLDLNRITDQIFYRIEKKIRIENERQGKWY